MHAELETLLGEVCAKEAAGDRVAAFRLLDRAPQALQHLGSYHFTRGALSFRMGEVSRAIDAFERAVRLGPEVAEYHSNLGAALFERARRSGALSEAPPAQAEGDLQRAAECLERACGLSPRRASVFSNLGLVRTAQGRAEEALTAFDQALALDPDDVPTLYNLAAAQAQLGRDEACLQTLERLLEVDPRFAPAKASRESTLSKLGRAVR